MPEFRPFDPRGVVRQTRRHLPHWEQPGATYFVTFRLADAVPAATRARLQELRDLNEADAFAWVERYLDAGAGACLLARPEYSRLMESTLRFFDGEHYALGAFAVMPNHVHALMQPLGARTRAQVIHGWKSYSAHQLQHDAAIHGSVWQEEGFDRIVRNEDELKRFDGYIWANPVAAKLSAGKYVIGRGTADWCGNVGADFT